MASKNYLEDVRFDRALKLHSGEFVHNYKELVSGLKDLTESQFQKHVRGNLDEISTWIQENYSDSELIAELKGVTSKQKYTALIEHKVKKLESKQQNSSSGKSPTLAWLIVLFILVGLIVFQHVQFSKNYRTYEREIINVKQELYTITNEKHQLENQVAIVTNERNDLADENQRLKYDNADLLDNLVPDNNPFYAPKDRVAEDQIRVQEWRFVVNTKSRPVLSRFTATGSMLPVLGPGSNGIEIEVKKPDEIKVGDIISFETDVGSVIHRVIEIGIDDVGWYAITKGDSNPKPDDKKVRFSHVKRVIIGILY